MTTRNSILVESVQSNKSENMVWAVYVQGNEQDKSYCKSPYKAMRFAFFLKKRTGLYISDICLTRLSMEIKRQKEAAMTAEQKAAKAKVDEIVEQFVEEHSVDNVLAKAEEEKKQKASRKRKPAVPLVAEGSEDKPAPKRRRASKKAKEVVAA
ncbi:MAG: hypothetical protein J5953_13475 [Prevotella sp.]|nr:hypothetical protein [Prevotella sp.]